MMKIAKLPCWALSGLVLAAGNQAANPYAVADLEDGIQTVLAETHAYRLHFARADKESLNFHPQTD